MPNQPFEVASRSTTPKSPKARSKCRRTKARIASRWRSTCAAPRLSTLQTCVWLAPYSPYLSRLRNKWRRAATPAGAITTRTSSR